MNTVPPTPSLQPPDQSVDSHPGDARFASSWFGRHVTLWALVLAILLTVLQVPFLTRYPAVRPDEGWNANRAWTWLTTGQNTTTIDVGPRAAGQGNSAPAVATAVMMASLRLFGLGLFQVRLPSLLFGAILLLATFLIGRLLYDGLTGLLAELALGLSWVFLTSSHLARPDILLAAFVALAVVCGLWGQRSGRLWPHGLAGLLIMLSVEVHQNGLIFAVALGFAYLVTLGPTFWRARAFWVFLAGAFVGSLVFRSIYAMLASVLGIGSTQLVGYNLSGGQGLAGSHRPPLLELTPTLFVQSLLAEVYYRFAPVQNLLPMAVIVAGLVYLLWRRSRADRVLLAFVGTVFLLFVLLLQNKTSEYTILLYPYLVVAAAAALTGLLASARGRTWRTALILLIALFLASSVFHSARLLWTHVRYSYRVVSEQVDRALHDQGRLLAMPTWWLAVPDRDFRSTVTLTDYHYLQGYTLTEALQAVRPDYLLVDELWRSRLVDEGYFPEEGMGRAVFFLPRQEFYDFLAERSRKTLELVDAWHGTLEVYELQWD
jgi:4-amino-4-deoxy-L-arabinose transferase-like glycosyltransferase